ncbi:MAG: spore cortex biosynthesis protein YabQ [Clostridia bacterium]|nr:spore cortex biosynthesis protein YabQ [Clostridia bacterium]
MEYSPKLLASLTVQSIILGFALGVLYSLLQFSRILLGERAGSAFSQKAKLPRFLVAKQSRAFTEKGLMRGILFFLRFSGDVLFCLSAAIGIILLAYVGNNGRIRWFILLGTALGYTSYTLTVGRLFSYFSQLLALMVRLVLGYAVRALLFPLKTVWKGIRSLYGVVLKRCRACIRQKRDARFHTLQMKALLASAEMGFDCMMYVGLEAPIKTSGEAVRDGSHIAREDVKNKRRGRVYGRKTNDENARKPIGKAS